MLHNLSRTAHALIFSYRSVLCSIPIFFSCNDYNTLYIQYYMREMLRITTCMSIKNILKRIESVLARLLHHCVSVPCSALQVNVCECREADRGSSLS